MPHFYGDLTSDGVVVGLVDMLLLQALRIDSLIGRNEDAYVGGFESQDLLGMSGAYTSRNVRDSLLQWLVPEG